MQSDLTSGATDLGETVQLTLPPALVEALNRYAAEEERRGERENLILDVLKAWAAHRGYLAGDDDGLRPEELNAANDD